MKKFNVALAECWHPHIHRYYPVLQKRPETAIAGVWDTDAKRGAAYSEKLGAPFVADYAELLKRPDVDAVCICAQTCLHRDLMVAAANAGKHIFTEKAFTLSTAEALDVRDAVLRNNVKLSVACIRACTPVFRFGKMLADREVLGDLNMVRIRNGVNWKGDAGRDLPDDWYDRQVTGGGVFVDLGMHQLYLFDWLLGEPLDATVSAIHYFGRDIEDNVSFSLRFKNGALGVAESSATTFYSPYTFELFGTQGTYLCRIDQDQVEVHIAGERLEAFKQAVPEGVEYECRQIGGVANNLSAESLFGTRVAIKVKASSLPPCAEPLDQWIDACVHGQPLEFGIEGAVRLARMTEGCCKALEWKKVVSF